MVRIEWLEGNVRICVRCPQALIVLLIIQCSASLANSAHYASHASPSIVYSLSVPRVCRAHNTVCHRSLPYGYFQTFLLLSHSHTHYYVCVGADLGSFFLAYIEDLCEGTFNGQVETNCLSKGSSFVVVVVVGFGGMVKWNSGSQSSDAHLNRS